MSTEQRTSNLNKKIEWLFFFDVVSQQLGIQITLQFMNMFMTNFLMLAPFAVAGILSVGRIVDLVVSSFAGAIVQKGNLKSGPLRTHILINGPLLAIGNFFIFLNPNVGATAKIVLFIIGYLFRNLPQSLVITASNALVPKVAGSNMNDRLALTVKKRQGSSTVSIFTSMATIPLVTFFNNTAGNGRGYLITALIYCGVQTIVGFLVYKGLAPYDQYDPHAKKVEGSAANVKVTHMYADTFKNPQVWILIVPALFMQVASSTLGSLNAYYNIYVLGNISYMAITTTVGAWVALGASIVIPPISKKLGKKKSYVVGNFGQVIAHAGILIFAKGVYPIFLGFQMVSRISQGISGVVGVNIWGDAAEYQLFKTGRDSRPFIMSLQSVAMKIGQFISSFTYAIILSYTGFEAVGGGNANLDINKLHNSLYGYMLATYILATLLYMCFGVTEEKSREYAEANKKLLDERAAAVGVAKE
ncbi:MAG: MFS transporter [Eubacteriaceae bacterium]|nr:MFS transporter [Eubacteriaceae bacterium]